MQYWRCKCGQREMWGSMGPKDCQGCDVCGTTLAQAPEGHKEPKSHEWVTHYDEITGKPYVICKHCLETKEE